MPSTLPSLNSSINKIDPTQGLVDYVMAVKPYHTKILDVLIEYVYTDKINVTVTEDVKWDISETSPVIPTEYTCGYGYRWDSSGVGSLDQYPVATIISADGEIDVQAFVTSNSSTISVPHNSVGFTFSVGDTLTFTTTGLFPTLTTGAIVPGAIYHVVAATSTTIQIAATAGGIPLIISNVGTGDLFAIPQSANYNTFLIQAPTTSNVSFIPIDVASNQFAFVDSFNVVTLTSSTRTIVVSGNMIASNNVDVGTVIYISSNTGVGTNGRYTISSVSATSSQTTIVVNEPISLAATSTGKVNVIKNWQNIPYWVSGTIVKVAITGTAPIPLANGGQYYFVQAPTLGTFNLATVRYPQSFEQYVDITTLGNGAFTITKTEPFVPGTPVIVDGSFANRNDGKYIVSNVLPEGSNWRVWVMQKVPSSSPAAAASDGIMYVDAHARDGYSSDFYCAPTNMSPLHAETFISEKLLFQFEFSFTDYASANIYENQTGGYGIDPYSLGVQGPYGTAAQKFEPTTAVSGGSPQGATTMLILPTGYDAQLYDLGGMDETLDVVRAMYGGTF